MGGYDILINKKLLPEEIAAGLASAFKIALENVKVVADISLDIPKSEEIAILCQYIEKGGELKTLLQIYIRDNSLQNYEDEEIGGHLSELWNCSCLVSDEVINPFTMIKITGVGKKEVVALDADLMNKEIYQLANDGITTDTPGKNSRSIQFRLLSYFQRLKRNFQ